MYKYIKAIETSLSDDKKDMLKRIYEPVEVCTPLADSRRDVCILPNGEIRSYGKFYASGHIAQDGIAAYLSSVDCGLSWEIKYSHGAMNSCSYMERGDIYITSCDSFNNNFGLGDGLFVFRSKIGPDDPDPEIIKLSDERYVCSFLPVQSSFSNRIWFTAQLRGAAKFFYSDDLGKTWEKRDIAIPDSYETIFPDKGLCWCFESGAEPHVTEISEEKMMMILRTPLDRFYQSFSYDGGDTWSVPEPSDFYGHNTTAFLLKLSDGRIINFWNNTKPLSVPNNKNMSPYMDKGVVDGWGQGAFTNRDAAHAAITEDKGKSWIGYREIILNNIRNNTDFRYIGGTKTSHDKSVHQFQAFELPFNKILVSAGQNPASRRLIIFDIDWLYESTCKEDFVDGLGKITTHTYLKSISGHTVHLAGNGHCAWNRTNNAYLMPDPVEGFRESLYISKHHDERLLNDIGGACWNFPMSKKGKVTAEIKIMEKKARFILSDRWYNTCDEYAVFSSPFWFELDKEDLKEEFSKVYVEFDTNIGMATVYIDGEAFYKVKMNNPCPTGISYLILQCATDGDSKGFYIRSLEKENVGK